MGMILMSCIFCYSIARDVSRSCQKKCNVKSCEAVCSDGLLQWESYFQKRAGMYRRNRCICEVTREFDEFIPGLSILRDFLARFPWSRVWYECIDNTWFLEPQYHA